MSTAIGRLDGYRQALAQNHLIPLPGHIVSLGTSGDHRGEKGGYEAAKRMLSVDPLPDGIFCFNDPSALGAMRAILDAGLRIPEDVAVVGCGNLSYSDFLRVPLTSVDQGSESIGKLTADLAMKIARKKGPAKSKRELITPHIVTRASSLRRPRPPSLQGDDKHWAKTGFFSLGRKPVDLTKNRPQPPQPGLESDW